MNRAAPPLEPASYLTDARRKNPEDAGPSRVPRLGERVVQGMGVALGAKDASAKLCQVPP